MVENVYMCVSRSRSKTIDWLIQWSPVPSTFQLMGEETNIFYFLHFLQGLVNFRKIHSVSIISFS